MPPAVSILLPVYNASEFLPETMQSILEQTHQDFELIAIDDSSADNSFEILKDFARKDRRVVTYQLKNRGLAATLNEAIRIAKHELLVRIDGDDIMATNRLERQICFMDQHPELAVATSFAKLIDKRGRIVGESRPKIDIDLGVRQRNPAPFVDLIHPACILRKAAILSADGYSETIRFNEDRELWGRLVTAGYRLGVQPEFLLQQRIHGSSVSITRVREGEIVGRYIDQNIVRRLDSKPDISFEEYLEERKKASKLRAWRRDLSELSLIRYKQATREFAERQWIGFAAHALEAIALNPAYAVRMIQKLNFQSK